MNLRLVINTISFPNSQERADAFNAQVREAAALVNVRVLPGILWTHGPGLSYNFGLELKGPEEQVQIFADGLKMFLLMAKRFPFPGLLPKKDTWELGQPRPDAVIIGPDGRQGSTTH